MKVKHYADGVQEELPLKWEQKKVPAKPFLAAFTPKQREEIMRNYKEDREENARLYRNNESTNAFPFDNP